MLISAAPMSELDIEMKKPEPCQARFLDASSESRSRSDAEWEHFVPRVVLIVSAPDSLITTTSFRRD
jgi:hypothetical protein